MHDERHEQELTEHERAMFAALPRESEVDVASEDRMVDVLRSEGYFRRGDRQSRWVLQLAAAITLIAAGAYGGLRYGERNSLERALARTDLTLSDRVLLLQRAGSTYIQAANGYADATAHIDSSAVEVASQVLLGAAQAVARRKLDAGMATWLTVALQPKGVPVQRMIAQ